MNRPIRRPLLALLWTLLLPGLCHGWTLAELTEGTPVTPELSGLQVSVMVRGQPESVFARGVAQVTDDRNEPLTNRHKIRVASISKLVVAVAVMQLVEQGKVDLDTDVSDYLGFELRNPAFPDTPISARQLLAHTSSIRDGERYFIRAGTGSVVDFFDPQSPRWEEGAHYADNSAQAPGEYFTYANLNFGLLAAVIERVSGERLDKFMATQVLDPMGLTASFNVCDIPAPQRAAGFRKRSNDGVWDASGPWIAQVDGDAQPCFYGMEALADPAAFLDSYVPGSNSTLFSPQGGLRASADDLLNVLQMLYRDGAVNGSRILSSESVAAMLASEWQLNLDGSNGQSAGEAEPGSPADGLMTDYGLSVHRINLRDWGFNCGPEYVVGHLGNAYGVLSMALFAPESGDGIAAIITGTAADPALGPPGHTPLYRVEEELLAWWLQRYAEDGACGVAVNDHPKTR